MKFRMTSLTTLWQGSACANYGHGKSLDRVAISPNPQERVIEAF